MLNRQRFIDSSHVQLIRASVSNGLTILSYLASFSLLSGMILLEVGRSMELYPQLYYSQLQSFAGGDTFVHFYGGVVLYISGFSLLKAFGIRANLAATCLIGLILVLILGELTHLWLPNRAFQMEDLYAGCSGATVGWFIVQLMAAIRKTS